MPNGAGEMLVVVPSITGSHDGQDHLSKVLPLAALAPSSDP
jgi:hypothetical protein